MTGLSINKHIYSLLSTDEQLKGVTLFPIVAQEETKYPFMLYQRVEMQPIYAKNITVGDKVAVAFKIVSDKYNRTVEIAERVRELLELRTSENYSQVTIIDCSEEWNNDGYVQHLTFQFHCLREV